MKTAFVYVPDSVHPDDVLDHYGNTRLPSCAKAVFFTPEAVGEATEQDKVRDFREEIAAYTNEHGEPVMVGIYSMDLTLLRRVIFDLLEHGLPVVFELDDQQRDLIGACK
uniref:Uncharacterized protein n=1 Tax=Pseudomonas phage HRDY3 TaxID=3236930 RepID=A0AB39CE43_9VIRU